MLQDKKIIEAIIKGENNVVFKDLYKFALPPIVKFIKSKNGTRQQAEDCFQDAIVALIMSVKQGKFKDEYSISNYLFGAARNRWFTTIRNSLSKETVIEGMDFELMEGNKLLEKEKLNTIDAILKKLGSQCEQLLKLSLFEKKRLSEIKEIMNFSNEGVVKTYNYRCKQKLRTMIKNDIELQNVLRN